MKVSITGTSPTVMVTLSVTEPLLLVAVMIYSVVTTGDTLSEPAVATEPIPWSMLTVFALVDVQVSVDEPPAVITSGDADIFTMGSWVTVTVTLAVLVPYALIAVMVYVVVRSGDTTVVPLAATVPIP